MLADILGFNSTILFCACVLCMTCLSFLLLFCWIISFLYQISPTLDLSFLSAALEAVAQLFINIKCLTDKVFRQSQLFLYLSQTWQRPLACFNYPLCISFLLVIFFNTRNTYNLTVTFYEFLPSPVPLTCYAFPSGLIFLIEGSAFLSSAFAWGLWVLNSLSLFWLQCLWFVLSLKWQCV